MKNNEYNDYELISFVQENIEEAKDIIYEKYLPIIKKIAFKWSGGNENLGIDENDLIQEGLVGLSKAIDHFRESKETSFNTYAVKCIENKMKDLMIGSNRQKYKILNEAIPVDVMNENGEYKIFDILKVEDNDPANLIIGKEEEKNLIEKLKLSLTEKETKVFELKYQGFSLKEISEKLNWDYRLVDNTVQRIKKKLKKIIASDN